MSQLQERPADSRTAALLDPPPTNPRAARRRLLYLIGLVPLLVALAFTVKVTTMRHHDGAGLGAWKSGNGAKALEQYSANKSLNLLQPWLAPFDAGDAAFLLGDYPRARKLFFAALDSVPHKQECTVRINLALTDEAIGDAASEAGSLDDAKDAWQAGIDALDGGDCPQHAGLGERQSQDATRVRQRLEQKLKQPPQQQQQSQQDPQKQPKNDGSGSEKSNKEKELDKRNRSGSQDRSKAQDLDDYDDFHGEYAW